MCVAYPLQQSRSYLKNTVQQRGVMNHVTSIALRSSGLCRGNKLWPQAGDLIRVLHSCSKPVLRSSSHSQAFKRTVHPPPNLKCCALWRPINETKRHFHSSQILQKLKPYPEEDEPGLAFREQDVGSQELTSIFGSPRPGDAVLNRFLRVVHARRVDGTLDIPFDKQLQAILDDAPTYTDTALKWLRKRFPVDEERAIVDRLNREDGPRVQESPSALMQRAQDIGFFKPKEEQSMSERKEYYGPQSGAYYAELSEKQDDVFGKSQLERIRAANEAKAEEEERRFQERIDQSLKEAEEKAREKSQVLAERPDQNLEVADGRHVRPPNLFEKWVIQARDRATSDLTLDSPEVKSLTTWKRIWPSALFVLICCGGLYLLTEFWEPPRRSERFFPDTSLAMATCGTLFAINLLVFFAWKFPPALKMLNKYFLVIPGYPQWLSMLGNIFSHNTGRHIFGNMLSLFIFGPSLHEEVGRANFLAIYLGSGLIGSLFSLSLYAWRGILITSSQGASGCLWGIMSAYFWLHKDSRFTFFFLPQELQEYIKLKGWVLLLGLVPLDVAVAIRKGTVDLAAHIGGLVTGIVSTSLWKAQHGLPEQLHKPMILSGARDKTPER